MIASPMSLGGMVTAPHHLAAQAGRDILRAGGTAIEAAVATAAALAVLYPHMTGLGGDGFWLISDGPAQPPRALHATGAAGARATEHYYTERGHSAIPWRGAAAACTVPGTVAGWEAALAHSARQQQPLPLARLLEPATHYARTGICVTRSQAALARSHFAALSPVSGFAEVYLPDGAPPAQGQTLRQPALAETLARLAKKGLRDFYEGETATRLAADLAAADSPITAEDLARHRAEWLEPLALHLPKTGAMVYNTRPPTQGLASLMILGMAEHLDLGGEGSFAHIHALVEATKRAFLLRDLHVADRRTVGAPEPFLQPEALAREAAAISPERALPWPQPAAKGDTIWLGVTDAQGRSVSFIQSLYFEYGSGLVSPQTGIMMQNRGASFRLSGRWNRLEPGRQPFTTLNPAMALFEDGRSLTYGTMGGEGQPQTQAAILTRMARFRMEPQAAISAPRWLLGRTWGQESTTLKLENRFDGQLAKALEAAGHQVEIMGGYEDAMGHAGAILRQPDGLLLGATDPRSDGAVAAL